MACLDDLDLLALVRMRGMLGVSGEGTSPALGGEPTNCLGWCRGMLVRWGRVKCPNL